MGQGWREPGNSFIVQARPETVQSQRGETAFKSYAIRDKGKACLAEGLAIGDAAISGSSSLPDRKRARQ